MSSALALTSIPSASLLQRAHPAPASPLGEMLALIAQPGIRSFALGFPDQQLFPRELLAELMAELTHDALQYGAASQHLKAQLVELMALRGVDCTAEELFLCSGSQQALSLIVRLLVAPGGAVVVEEVTYTGFHQVIAPLNPQVLTVPSDPSDGIDVETLALLLERGIRPGLIYTIPEGHNPLGTRMSLERRLRLVELARRYEIPIIEDDAYGLLSLGDAPLPPLRELAPEWVIYVGSFSKIVAPGLRVGWAVVPAPLVASLNAIKDSADLNTSTLTQQLVAAYLESGALPGHLERARASNSWRRDLMLDALERHFPAEARWRRPEGGMYCWVELPAEVDASILLRRAVAEEHVAFMPGIAFTPPKRPGAASCMRLAFTACPPDQIEAGIAGLGRAIRRQLGT